MTGAPTVLVADVSVDSHHKLLFSEVYESLVKIHSEFTLGLHQVSVYPSLFLTTFLCGFSLGGLS